MTDGERQHRDSFTRQVRIVANNVFAKETCIFCMGQFSAGSTVAVFYETCDEDGKEHEVGLICDLCLGKSPAEVQASLIQRAERLEASAAWYRSAAVNEVELPKRGDLDIAGAVADPTCDEGSDPPPLDDVAPAIRSEA